MNGGHDLGGMHGLGPIDPEPVAAEPVFHNDWEKRVFALTLATGALGQWTIDMGRHARERQHPADYLRHTYYENWLAGLEKLLVERGLVSAEELASGRAAGSAAEALRGRLLSAAEVAPAIARCAPVEMAIDAPPRFAVGDRVRAINRHPTGHTREPRYVRGGVGIIHEHYGAHVFPDLSAAGRREGRHLYSVRFTARELWGEPAREDAVYVDLWEDYLERAG
jgi:nitrile hydratase subunit beta